VPAALLVSLPLILMWWVLKEHSPAARWSYGALVTLLVLGFGLQDGLWNHTVKMIIFFLRGADRANMAGLPFPPVGACSMRSPACSPLSPRSSQHIPPISSSPRPASCRPQQAAFSWLHQQLEPTPPLRPAAPPHPSYPESN
jgi:hypothetical protein